MQAETASGVDWRDAAPYAPLLEADRSLFAWEWLRRDPRYCAAAEAALSTCDERREDPAAAAFGLIGFEAPCLRVPHARPLWRQEVHSLVLPVEHAAGGAADDAFLLDRFNDIAVLLSDRQGEHLLLSDGVRTVRLDGLPEAFSRGPQCLRYCLEGLVAAAPRLLALRRFLMLCRTGRFARSLHTRESRARRWILMLRTWDALAAGADQREIAQALLGGSAGEPRWRSNEPSLRSQAQRLVRSARVFAAGAYRGLLDFNRSA